jgi:hypothetical protein
VTESTFTNMTGSDSLAGAGAVDGAAQIVKSIQDGDWLAAGGNAVATGIDVLGFIENPVKSLGFTAIGWLLEHLTALDAFLDRTTGDPQAVQSAAETFYRAAQDLDGLAADQIKAFGMGVPTYRAGHSPSALAFEQRIGPRGDELKVLSLQCQGLGEAMNAAGVLVAGCRAVMRDLLCEFTWWLIKKATIALAAAPYTGGGSLAALLTDATITGAKLAKKLADELHALVKDLNGLLEVMQRLSTRFGNPARHAIATSVGKGFLPPWLKFFDDQVTLSAADDAEQQVAEHEAAERRAKTGTELNPPVPEKRQGPGLGARWTTSGSLDE